MRIAIFLAAIAAAMGIAAQPVSAATPVLGDFTAALYAGKVGDAVAVAERRVAAAPADEEARFALGTAQFFKAVENLTRSLYRYGLRSGDYGSGIGGLIGLPIVRVPVPFNPKPDELTYAAARQVLTGFVNDLAVAEKTLAAVPNVAIDMPMDIARIRLDIDGDGKGSDDETLWGIFAEVADLRDPGGAASGLSVKVDFDQADAVWLQGYCHLLMAMAKLPLAYDWQMAFDMTFPSLFPMPTSPYAKLYAGSAELDRLMAQLMALPESQRDRFYEDHEDDFDRLSGGGDFSGIADLIAFVHLNRWPLVEPARMQEIGGHLQALVRLSREDWQRILREIDINHAEWIPSPRQRGAVSDIRVTAEQVQGWHLFLDEFDALLGGKKLIPHWRFDEGVNLKKLLEQPPRNFDLVLFIQGAGVLPYLEKGELTGGETWRRMERLLGGDFFRYVLWFN